MNTFLKKHILQLSGMITGGIGGFLYYFYIGCSSGTCPISSNPYISIGYGSLLGYLLFDMFKRKEKS
jgi:Family of unknown function (DUF6132)